MLKRLPEFLAALFAPGLDSVNFCTRVARILRIGVGCQQVSFVNFHPDTGRLDVDFDPYVPEVTPALEGFGRHMARYPCFNCDPTVNDGRPFLRGDYLSDEEFCASKIYLEGFKVAGISDHAAMLLPSTDGTVFFLGLERRDGGTYRPEHRRRMVELQPHLGNARLLAQTFATYEYAVTDPVALYRAGLTPREADTLSLLASGKTNPEIATILGLSVATVKGYVKIIFDKLGVDNRHAATLRAHELTRPPSIPSIPTTRRASTVVTL